MRSFYIEDEFGTIWYWTGKGFTDIDEDAMLYTFNKPLQFIKDNLSKVPQVKAMLKCDPSLKLEDIKIG